MEKVCIAIDTSPSAELVAKAGFKYAKAINAEVTLVHSINEMAYYSFDYGPIMNYSGYLISQGTKIVENLNKEAHKFLDATAEYLGDTTIQKKVLSGETSESIIEFAESWGANLLVIGTHSHSVFENLLMGNTAVTIVKNSKIPILIIPIKEK